MPDDSEQAQRRPGFSKAQLRFLYTIAAVAGIALLGWLAETYL